VAPPVFKTGLSLLVGDGRFDSFPSPPTSSALASGEAPSPRRPKRTPRRRTRSSSAPRRRTCRTGTERHERSHSSGPTRSRTARPRTRRTRRDRHARGAHKSGSRCRSSTRDRTGLPCCWRHTPTSGALPVAAHRPARPLGPGTGCESPNSRSTGDSGARRYTRRSPGHPRRRASAGAEGVLPGSGWSG